MTDTARYAYVIPMHEGNTDADELAFWARRGELFRVYLMDKGGEYDGVNVATRAEAIELAHAMAAEAGWIDYEFSIDE